MARHETHEDIRRDFYNESADRGAGSKGALIVLAAIAVVVLIAGFYPSTESKVAGVASLEAETGIVSQPTSPVSPIVE